MNPVRDRETAEAPGEGPGERPAPDWWHRDHPTFTALTGFFTGLAFVALVPAAFVGLLHLVVDDETTNDLFPMVLVALAVPLGLTASRRTRRFGTYMLIGAVVTALVVAGVASLVVWFMLQRDL
jgi:hypothetical protein